MDPERPPTRSLAYHAIPVAYVLLAVVTWPHPPLCGFGDVDLEMYGVIARMWSRGMLPYADLYDFKPPLTFLLLRLGFATWGADALVLWKLQVVLVTVTAISLFYVLLRRDRPASAVTASAALHALGVFDAAGLRQFLRNTELWAVLPLVIALALLTHPPRRAFLSSVFCSGLTFGLALTAKQQVGPYLLPLLWLLCHEGWTLFPARRAGAMVRALALFGFGACLPFTVFGLYFAWHGALPAAFRAIFVDGQSYAALSDIRDLSLVRKRLSGLSAVQEFLTQPFMIPYAVCALAALALATRQGRDRVSMLLIFLAPTVAVMLSSAFYPHYLVLFFPALVFAVAQGGEILLGPAASGRSPRAPLVLFFGAALAFGSPVVAFIQQTPFAPSCVGEDADPLRELGMSIAARADADARLLVWDLSPRLYFYADVPPAVRFFCVMVTFGYEDIRDDLDRALARRPAFIAVSDASAPPERADTSTETMRRLLRDHYDLLTQNAAGAVFVRRRAAEDAGRDRERH